MHGGRQDDASGAVRATSTRDMSCSSRREFAGGAIQSAPVALGHGAQAPSAGPRHRAGLAVGVQGVLGQPGDAIRGRCRQRLATPCGTRGLPGPPRRGVSPARGRRQGLGDHLHRRGNRRRGMRRDGALGRPGNRREGAHIAHASCALLGRIRQRGRHPKGASRRGPPRPVARDGHRGQRCGRRDRPARLPGARGRKAHRVDRLTESGCSAGRGASEPPSRRRWRAPRSSWPPPSMSSDAEW